MVNRMCDKAPPKNGGAIFCAYREKEGEETGID